MQNEVEETVITRNLLAQWLSLYKIYQIFLTLINDKALLNTSPTRKTQEVTGIVPVTING